ncbi:hypothetical protein PGT21_016132 [Puccinia graminis f. sp. tritici]|uniref:Hydrophobin n=2 Tax=Puccinia graminis f. sp. tritici TaxID=56615 RepID=E3L998_PUCGT|nr:uncharacterized protein PGTG_19228 [Puccinia graminis f. sp. tritici CRL 75-36-700-3]EFP93123.1 hypothetical protein PGTG_19228 [Puccinia graminis f. sp. tritici CRL 75-36-700-3]KAA1074694.1 hypothetical protein PGT21_016132 [Puccinia graminis f. sp. tritici]KAA1115881.1 hypothetical protein PGTUg99_013281 [Puccinia graminis f. sp. tritici]
MLFPKQLFLLAFLYGSSISARSLQKRLLKSGKCDLKITAENNVFASLDKNLAKVVQPRIEGNKFLKNLCGALNQANCGNVDKKDVDACNNLIKKATTDALGAAIATKWNKECCSQGGGGGQQKKKQAGNGTQKKNGGGGGGGGNPKNGGNNGGQTQKKKGNPP